MKRLDKTLICFMEANGAIAGEDREIYEYALKSVRIIGGNLITSLVIGFGLRMPWYCMLLLVALLVLRSDAGGYHAATVWRCYAMSCAGLAAALLWVRAALPGQAAVTLCLAAASFFLIFLLAPLEAKNKPLDEKRKRVAQKRARVIVTVEMAAGILCFAVDQKAAVTLLCAVVWCGLGYIGWFLEKKHGQEGV